MRNFKLLLAAVFVAGLSACSQRHIKPLSEPKAENGSTFSLRHEPGNNLLTGEKRPLIVLDGKIVNNDTLINLDPNSIESIQVLKGKSAAALYGDKGENGVIVIVLKD